jgi:hypothetical protein
MFNILILIHFFIRVILKAILMFSFYSIRFIFLFIIVLIIKFGWIFEDLLFAFRVIFLFDCSYIFIFVDHRSKCFFLQFLHPISAHFHASGVSQFEIVNYYP